MTGARSTAGVGSAEGRAWDEVPRQGAPGGPRWWQQHLGVVVGLAVALLLAASGRTTGALALVAVVTLLTVLRLAIPRFDRAVGRFLLRFGHGVGRLVSLVLLGGLMVVVLTPVWALARLGRWDMLRIGSERPGRWARRRLRRWQDRPEQPFTREARPVARRRLHGALLVALPVVVLLAAALPLRHWWADQRQQGGRGPVPPSISGSAGTEGDDTASTPWVVEGQFPQRPGDPLIAQPDPWAPEVLRSRVLVFEYDPTNILRVRDVQTEYFNYEDRTRVSWRPPVEGPSLDVWLFGSSMLLGPSVIRDDHTVASELARRAWEVDRIPVTVANFGIPGYETWQQMVLMAQMLTERPPPDLVVFYGGYNDLHNYLPPGAPTEVSNTWAEDFATALRESGASVQPPDPASVEVTGDWDPANAASVYDRSISVTENILDARGIPFVNLLQPSLVTRARPEDGATLDSIGADERWMASYGQVYDAARARIRSDVVDLSDALDDLPGVVYWDEVHHNEAGTAAVAEAAYPHLREQLQALWAASGP